jgi:uncharacterized membrane protein
MAHENSITNGDISTVHPTIKSIDLADIRDVLKKGLSDFNEKPSHIVLLMVIYPVLGLIFARAAAGYDLLPLVFPLVSGFALIGPIVALGVYELSRRREQGLPVQIRDAFNVIHSPSILAIVELSILLGVIYLAWLGSAQAIYWATFGSVAPTSFVGFVEQIFMTQQGWTLILAGCGVGFMFALAVLAIAAISFPMLLDKEVDVATAIHTSARAFAANPLIMLAWGLTVTGLLILGAIPLFYGLAITMPIVGHATWHLYRKIVEY